MHIPHTSLLGNSSFKWGDSTMAIGKEEAVIDWLSENAEEDNFVKSIERRGDILGNSTGPSVCGGDVPVPIVTATALRFFEVFLLFIYGLLLKIIVLALTFPLKYSNKLISNMIIVSFGRFCWKLVALVEKTCNRKLPLVPHFPHNDVQFGSKKNEEEGAPHRKTDAEKQLPPIKADN
jgi:hypothetical protein